MLDYNKFIAQYINYLGQARCLGEQYLKLDDRRSGETTGNIEFNEGFVSIQWHWFGSYGAEDSGWIHIPSDLLDDDNGFETWAKNDISKQHKQQDRDEQARKDAYRQQEIDNAKDILERAGIKI